MKSKLFIIIPIILFLLSIFFKTATESAVIFNIFSLIIIFDKQSNIEIIHHVNQGSISIIILSIFNLNLLLNMFNLNYQNIINNVLFLITLLLYSFIFFKLNFNKEKR